MFASAYSQKSDLTGEEILIGRGLCSLLSESQAPFFVRETQRTAFHIH